MNIKELNFFVKVVELKSISLVAEYFSVTQSTVSKAIKKLEDKIGTPLFSRRIEGRTKEISLTIIGEDILKEARIIIDAQERIKSIIKENYQLEKGQLKLDFPPLGLNVFKKIIYRYNCLYPDIDIIFTNRNSINSEEIDIGLMIGDVTKNMNSMKIMESPLCLLTTKNSRWKGKEKINFHELKYEKLLANSEQCDLYKMVEKASEVNGFKLNVIFKSNQWDFLTQMVEYNSAIAIFPEKYCKTLDHHLFDFFPIEQPNFLWKLNMTWDATKKLTPMAKAWLDLVNQYHHEIIF